MSPEAALGFLEELMESSPTTAALVLEQVTQAFKLRPAFLHRQPRAKQAEWMRKVMGRVAAAAAAEEILAEFLLDRHGELLTELLDALGLEHEEGQLKEAHPACPAKKKLETAVKTFLKGKSADRRRLLLEAFAAQSAIDWPELEALLPAR